MATKTSQRIGIWIIAIVMVVGTIAGFAALILIPKNEATDRAQLEEEYKAYMEQVEKADQERLASLRPLDGYAAAPFDAASVTSLSSEVLVAGTGTALTETSGMTVNYFGWTADGKIFDSTNVNGTVTPNGDITLDGVIVGWKEGLVGKTAGSTVLLTIPGDKAYGNTDTGTGRPVGPLKFVIQIIEVK